MKLLRFGPKGQEKPGLLDGDGNVRDLSGVLADITPETLSPQGLAALRALDPATLPVVKSPGRLGVPFSGLGKFLAVGLNYSDHAAEAGLDAPSEPVLFTKWENCLNGPNDAVVLPKNAVKGDWEVELGFVIGKTARYVPLENALDYVAGYCLVNDVSEREFQIERGGTWDKGKGFDTFGPVGPWLVTTDEIRDPQQLGLWLDVNGVRRQTGHTSKMIFSVAYLVHYMSQFATLKPGDLVTTGTPPGVGLGQKPPVFLKPGDVMHLGIDGLGEQTQEVHAYDTRWLD
ncbi:fumarylacetoacetate hydrolase family protein [Pandoraea soli]|uniref:Ureidoglycolate lyase n=1 Tax=Pandoraea soli TaxID=2508293 RepID=A0ABY6W5B5_9BURK|nr:fumarylacetoacetate hydrolase family protein [Pandoraea soli]VVE27960.1 Ureidoglycolate lyase [Pandoraea soli]